MMASVPHNLDERNILLVSNKPPESLIYDPQQSYLLSYGIEGITLASAIKSFSTNDVDHLASALIDTEVLPKMNAKVYTSSSDRDHCTKEGMKLAFREQASKVGQEGIFIFAYSGPGMEVGSQELEWSLTPINFQKDNPLMYLTGATLLQWISELQHQPKHVLLILDCAFAGRVASQLTQSNRFQSVYSLSVLCACSTTETAFFVESLGHSIFNYFAAWAFRVTHFVPGFVPLKGIFDKIKISCVAFTSLIVTYDPIKRELKPNTVEPRIKSVVVQLPSQFQADSDDIDGGIGRYEFLTKHFNLKSKPGQGLHNKALAWLETVREGPLAELQFNDAIHGEMLSAVVGVMMFSIASIQIATEKGTASDPNILIIAFLNVAATISAVNSDVEITSDHFKHSWEFYHQVLKANGVQDKEVRDLFLKVCTGTEKVIG